ncbi:sarcosine oxidase subunit gamma [Wenxinia saemankumensis]|uniref:Sarcosine oxidase subunit gamma n=1 Tax=Wenxinia saemankumensis TaxID=1447782 RepID=A0A1M6ATB8_9RHOB|nr:sarcosine oxidase subunit gamma family protein [Wenxinia saemankumensis]SHI39715.1 sarcosine oxidase subunit gamma [Wenxinia saemankumensis]
MAEATIREAGPVGMVTFRGDLGAEPVQRALGEVAGLDLPERGRAAIGARTLLWMSPDELMLVCDRGEAGALAADLSARLDGVHHLALDISDARTVLVVEGAVREVLAKLAPVDLHPSVFPVGAFRRTRLNQVAAAFWLVSETEARVICFRSVAEYVRKLLDISAEAPVAGLYD